MSMESRGNVAQKIPQAKAIVDRPKMMPGSKNYRRAEVDLSDD